MDWQINATMATVTSLARVEGAMEGSKGLAPEVSQGIHIGLVGARMGHRSLDLLLRQGRSV